MRRGILVSKFSVALFGLTLAGGMLTACAGGSLVPEQNASTVKDLSQFDPDDFNAGNTFEYLVNPDFMWTGEADNEVYAEDQQDWLAALDKFSLQHEENNFVTMQAQYTDAEIDEHNDALLKRLKREATTEIGYSKAEAKKLYKALTSQEQVWNHAKYDPEFSIGFCFGRAMIVHGFAKNSYKMVDEERVEMGTVPVRKIWVSGPMGQWKHHVATMVMAKEADVGFWVVDNYVGRVKSAAEWIEHLRDDYPNTNVLFNVTRANRFSEANSLRYFQVLLDDPFFNDFFRDFLVTNVEQLHGEGLDVTVQEQAPIGGGANPFAESVIAVESPEATATTSNAAAFGGETIVPRQHN